MERNAAEAQERRNAADALRAPPIRSTWRSVQSGGLFHLVLADFAKVPEGTKGLVQQLSLEDVQEGEGIFVFSLARFKSGSNNMTLEYAPRDRFMALGHALEARGGGGGGGGETSCASAEAAASLFAEGYRPMLVGGNPPALPFGPSFTGKLTDFQSVAHGIPILYASLNGTDDPNILTRMVANKLCSGNAGTACERVFATDDYREGAVLAPMSLTSATHTKVKQIYPTKGGEVVSFETRNQPELNAYHLWDVGEAGRLLGQEQVEPLLKWGLALPLQLFCIPGAGPRVREGHVRPPPLASPRSPPCGRPTSWRARAPPMRISFPGWSSGRRVPVATSRTRIARKPVAEQGSWRLGLSRPDI